MKFTVKRSKWVRGGLNTKYGPTYLLNKEGNMCCLGFVCKKLGASKDELFRVGFPSFIQSSHKIAKTFQELLPDLDGKVFEDEAASINDDPLLKSNTREARLKKLFRSRGHEIVFVP